MHSASHSRAQQPLPPHRLAPLCAVRRVTKTNLKPHTFPCSVDFALEPYILPPPRVAKRTKCAAPDTGSQARCSAHQSMSRGRATTRRWAREEARTLGSAAAVAGRLELEGGAAPGGALDHRVLRWDERVSLSLIPGGVPSPPSMCAAGISAGSAASSVCNTFIHPVASRFSLVLCSPFSGCVVAVMRGKKLDCRQRVARTSSELAMDKDEFKNLASGKEARSSPPLRVTPRPSRTVEVLHLDRMVMVAGWYRGCMLMVAIPAPPRPRGMLLLRVTALPALRHVSLPRRPAATSLNSHIRHRTHVTQRNKRAV